LTIWINAAYVKLKYYMKAYNDQYSQYEMRSIIYEFSIFNTKNLFCITWCSMK